MKASPLKIKGFEYPVVSVRANPMVDPPEHDDPLMPKVSASIGFAADGKHFAIINAKQSKKSKHYTFEIEAFTTFGIDVDACRDCYANGWTPNMLAVNVARLLYSGIREVLASITSRAPYGLATLPSTTLGPEDVHIEFEPREKRDEVLIKYFDFSPERIDELNRRLSGSKVNPAGDRQGSAAKRAKKQALPKPSPSGG